jgi:integrase
MNEVLTATLKEVRMNGLADDLVSYNHKGTPYRSFRSAFEQAVRKAGLEDFTFHDLQYTSASCAVMAKVHRPTVKELLGHTDITATLRYRHLASAHRQCAVRTLQSFGEKVRVLFTTDRARKAVVLL